MGKPLSFPIVQWDNSEVSCTKFLKNSPAGLSPVAHSSYPCLNAASFIVFSPLPSPLYITLASWNHLSNKLFALNSLLQVLLLKTQTKNRASNFSFSS